MGAAPVVLATSKVVGGAPKVVKAAKETVDNTTELVCSLETFSGKVVSAVDHGIAKIDAIKHCKIRHETKAKIACQDLATVAEKAFTYISSVDDLFWYGRDETRMGEVKDALRRGDFAPLDDFIDQLQRCLTTAEGFYTEFNEANTKAVASAVIAAETCSHKATLARSKKRAARALGGTLATGAIVAGTAGGVAASVVAGVFTFGVGTIVGLGITAVASTAAGAAVGTGAAVATCVIADDFDTTAREFRELSITFDSLVSAACDMRENALGVKGTLLIMAKSVDDVEHSRKKHRTITSVRSSLDLLYNKFNESYRVSSICRETVKSKKIKFRELVNSL